jgi:hypothetical protein
MTLNTEQIFLVLHTKTFLIMKNKKLQKLLKKNKSNAGFTLTELLVGLIMSTIVVAGLGWGLINILRTTSTETTRVTARSETSRAFTFVADEVKAAQFMEVDMGDFNIGNVAPGYQSKAISGATVRLALIVPDVEQRIVYSVAPKPSGSVWKGPLVIYRWGPNLNADGSYSDPGNTSGWQNEPLIDNVSDVDQTVQCGGNDVTYKGFFACVLDNDGDGGALENQPAIDINKDGQIKLIDGEKDGDDIDGLSITAQLYFAGKTDSKTDEGVYLADSQVVARARIVPEEKDEFQKPNPVYFQSLDPEYDNDDCWQVRNDFGHGEPYDLSDPDKNKDTGDPRFDPNSTNSEQNRKALKDVMTWVHNPKIPRQNQPLDIDPSKPFTMVASAFVDDPNKTEADCPARGDRYKQKLKSIDDDGENAEYEDDLDANGQKVKTDGKEAIHTYTHKVWHKLEFPNENDSAAERNRKLETFNGGATDKPNVRKDDPMTTDKDESDTVYMFRNGSDFSTVDLTKVYAGQPSIKQFLQDKGYVDANGNITGLKDNQRIVVFEIGKNKNQDGTLPPGFDLQDNMFIMTSDAFLSSNY